jgi:hypothetical protein
MFVLRGEDEKIFLFTFTDFLLNVNHNRHKIHTTFLIIIVLTIEKKNHKNVNRKKTTKNNPIRVFSIFLTTST